MALPTTVPAASPPSKPTARSLPPADAGVAKRPEPTVSAAKPAARHFRYEKGTKGFMGCILKSFPGTSIPAKIIVASFLGIIMSGPTKDVAAPKGRFFEVADQCVLKKLNIADSLGAQR
jgi:hypothetical protein